MLRIASPQSDAKHAHSESRIAWWREARFGMFIHWGVYSTCGGEYQGTDCPGYAEQILRTLKLTPQEYRSAIEN